MYMSNKGIQGAQVLVAAIPSTDCDCVSILLGAGRSRKGAGSVCADSSIVVIDLWLVYFELMVFRRRTLRFGHGWTTPPGTGLKRVKRIRPTDLSFGQLL